MRTSVKRLFAAILPLTGLLLTAPLATTAQAAHNPEWYRHHDPYAYRHHRHWRRYNYNYPYTYNRRWYGPERYSYYRPDPYWYAHRRHHHDD